MCGKFKSISLFCIFALLAANSALAQSGGGRVVDVKIYFPYDEAYIDSMYMGNNTTLHLVDSLLNNISYISTIERIEVIAQSSPEGSVAYNERLSLRRRDCLENYFTAKYPHIDSSIWYFGYVAENWELFHQDLVDDPNIPNREKVLEISQGSRKADDKEWLLRTMDGGKPWLYIKENILPDHRFGASVLFIPKERITVASPAYAPQRVSRAVSTESVIVFPEQEKFKALVAIKSNLVWDALSVVNLGVEIPIGERFSVVGEVVHPWWRSWPTNFTMQIESYHAEVKYWFGNRIGKEQLQGWSVGVYGGWGRYDIQPFTETGVQGYFYDLGAEIGYSMPLVKNWLNLEFNLGLGYVSTDYKDYYMAYDTEEFGDIKVIPYPWQTNRLRTVMPTRCGVSLVWVIGTNTKGGNQ